MEDLKLNHKQLAVLDQWLEVNNLDRDTLEWSKDLKNGVRFFATNTINEENWELDLVYLEEEDETR